MKRSKSYQSQSLIPEAGEPLLEPLSPTGGPLTPQPRPKYHGDECFCDSCCDIRAAMENYIAARNAFNNNGFN